MADVKLNSDEFAIRHSSAFNVPTETNLQMNTNGTITLSVTFAIKDVSKNFRDGATSPNTGTGDWGIFNKKKPSHFLDEPTNQMLLRMTTSTSSSRLADIILDLRLLTDGEKRESGHPIVKPRKS